MKKCSACTNHKTYLLRGDRLRRRLVGEPRRPLRLTGDRDERRLGSAAPAPPAAPPPPRERLRCCLSRDRLLRRDDFLSLDRLRRLRRSRERDERRLSVRSLEPPRRLPLLRSTRSLER